VRRAAFLVLAVLGASGCIYSPTSGSDAGVGEAGTQTVGDQCMAIDTEFCSYAINMCGGGGDLSGCVTNNMSACCMGSACSAISQYPQSTVDTCKAQIDLEDCNCVVNHVVPSVCLGPLNMPASTPACTQFH
jgi:hypothetical protein